MINFTLQNQSSYHQFKFIKEFYKLLSSKLMINSFKPRMSCDIQYSNAFKGVQQQVEPSFQAKKLIEYLKSNPNPDINLKLREQIFFKKIMKPIQQNQEMKRSSSQSKIQNLKNQSFKNDQKKSCYTDKTLNRRRGGFFSPKCNRTEKSKLETSPFVLFQKEKQTTNGNLLKNAFKLRRDIMSLNQDLVQSQKQIPFNQKVKQCPEFLKKGIKTTKAIKNSPRQNQIKIEDFVIFKNLGQGTFGQVFAAIHKATGSIFTIKKYKKDIIKTHQLQDKFIHDIKVQSKMDHPHIVKLFGFFDDQTYFYMVFQFMESGNLTKTIEQKGGRLTQIQVSRKVYEINQALLYLHEKRLIHRDIKPASVLTCLNVCKLCDTQWIQENDDTMHHNTLCKEIDYTAPEALEGKQITPEFDVWGLGLIAFELLTGKKLIQGATQKILIRKIITLKKQLIQVLIPKQCSQALRNIILSSLEPVASKRLKSSEINQIKLQKQKQLSQSLLSVKTIGTSQKSIGEVPRGSPKNGIIFGVKKQIKYQVSNLL